MEFFVNTIINDRYKLLKFIGRGSFGEVWLATDLKLKKEVAIKIYIALDPKGLNEFKNEFICVHGLTHPNLLRPDYFDSVGDNPYIVMPYCPLCVGNKVGEMEEAEIWTFIRDVANGLAYLHSKDIIHRDIKPDNILKDKEGNYVISDFGLSTKMRSTLRKASKRLNDAAGTIGYMAPEMFSANPNAVKATDIWALGASIYEIATGGMPFNGQGGIMLAHGAELPELPDKYSKALNTLMRKCLAKDPWDRPTAEDIKELIGERSSTTANTDDAVLKVPYDYEVHLYSTDNGKNDGHNGDLQKALKKKRFFKVSFWITICLLIISVVSVVMLADNYQSKLDEANNVINNIETICTNETSGCYPNFFQDWISTNHSNNSHDQKEYSISGNKGDIIWFRYRVDSESFDHFRALITSNAYTYIIEDVSGKNKFGVVSYKLPNNGDYTLRLEYVKDNSVSCGTDNVRVYNIGLIRLPIGVIMNEIAPYIKRNLNRYVEEWTSDVEDYVDVDPCTEADVDTCVEADDSCAYI